MHKLIFHLRKIAIIIYVWVRSKLNSWTNIKGVLLPIHQNIGYNTLRWILNGQYEQGEINIVKKRIASEDVILEIGTGLGFVATYCAKTIGAERIFTYEANVDNIPFIQAVFSKNNVTPILTNAYLSGQIGEFLFSINKNNRLGSSALLNSSQTVKIPMLDLNQEIARIKPTFLIMDIEGGEFDIFKIIEFQTIHKVQFELHPAILGEEKCNFIFDLLAQNGFVLDAAVSEGVNYYFYKEVWES